MESEVQKIEEFGLKQFAESQGELEELWRGRGVDWLLQEIGGWVNKGNLELSITLHTPAGVVSGTMISHQSYFTQFADRFVGNASGEDAESLRALLAGYGEPTPEDEEPYARLQYIHLQDAQFYSPGQPPMPGNGVLWRGKISAVCSFHLGRFAPA